MLALAILSSSLVACASWYSNDSASKEPDSPTVGSKDSSDFLFGQAADSPTDMKEDSGIPPMVAKPATASAAK
jgi:hypothetical protein